MKQKFHYYIATIILNLILKLPKYRTYQYLTHQPIDQLQARINELNNLRETVRYCDWQLFSLEMFGYHDINDRIVNELIHPAIKAKAELEKSAVEEDLIESLSAIYQLRNATLR